MSWRGGLVSSLCFVPGWLPKHDRLELNLMPACPLHRSSDPTTARPQCGLGPGTKLPRLLRGDAAAGAGSLGLLVLLCQGQTARSSHRTPGRVALAANFSPFANDGGQFAPRGLSRPAGGCGWPVCCLVEQWTVDKRETNFFSHAVSFLVQSLLQCPRPLPHDVGSLTSRLKPPCRLTAPPGRDRRCTAGTIPVVAHGGAVRAGSEQVEIEVAGTGISRPILISRQRLRVTLSLSPLLPWSPGRSRPS